MPEFEMPVGEQQTWQCLDDFTKGYWEAVFFTNSETVGDLTFANVAKSAWKQAVEDCKKFQVDNAALLARAYAKAGYNERRAGQDFWFTRNGHGAGFWDRKELEDPNRKPSVGDALSDACRHQEVDLYVHKGKIYFS